jgi:hypothetical protein
MRERLPTHTALIAAHLGRNLTAAAASSPCVAFVAALHLLPMRLRFGSSPEPFRSIGAAPRSSLPGAADTVADPVRRSHAHHPRGTTARRRKRPAR